jgi:uncharacterized protein (DUF3084 family)
MENARVHADLQQKEMVIQERDAQIQQMSTQLREMDDRVRQREAEMQLNEAQNHDILQQKNDKISELYTEEIQRLALQLRGHYM